MKERMIMKSGNNLLLNYFEDLKYTELKNES